MHPISNDALLCNEQFYEELMIGYPPNHVDIISSASSAGVSGRTDLLDYCIVSIPISLSNSGGGWAGVGALDGQVGGGRNPQGLSVLVKSFEYRIWY